VRQELFFKQLGISPKHPLLHHYALMLLARTLDDRGEILYKQSKAFFFISCQGHEIIQLAAATTFRPRIDWSWPYYRDLAYCIGLGVSVDGLLLSFMNKADDPHTGGRQMPMHYSSPELRIFTQSSPTGTQYLQAVGCALGAKKLKKDEVVYVSSGEGSCAEGDFHEALNWAAREKLPVVFVIQNNKFAISVPANEQLANESVAKLVSGYRNLHAEEVDGTDPQASLKAMKNAHERARQGLGPSLIEGHVVRLKSHSISDNQLKYRTEEEVTIDTENCPLIKLEKYLITEKLITETEIIKWKDLISDKIRERSAWAETQPDNKIEDLEKYVFNDLSNTTLFTENDNASNQEPLYLVDAINHTLTEEMTRDQSIIVYGQDIAKGKGGVFGVTRDLTTRFGIERVFNSQLAESAIIGTAIGLTLQGFKPVVEIQFGDYIWTAAMQIRNELCMIHYRSNGAYTTPVVIRVPVGAYIRGGAYHSQSIEATFSHFPGLLVAYPAFASDAQGLLRTAIRGKEPVLFLEHKGLYRQPYAKGVSDSNYLVPFGKGRIVKTGTDLTIISWGLVLHKCLTVANKLVEQGWSIEVIDLRTIVPLDHKLIVASVTKTHRVLICQEDHIFMGVGAEIAAIIATECFFNLDAPISRIGMKHVPHVPHAPILEDATLVQESDILAEATRLLRY
jgi:2-oxoisovalerate dehydrogenase E1 component